MVATIYDGSQSMAHVGLCACLCSLVMEECGRMAFASFRNYGDDFPLSCITHHKPKGKISAPHQVQVES